MHWLFPSLVKDVILFPKLLGIFAIREVNKKEIESGLFYSLSTGLEDLTALV